MRPRVYLDTSVFSVLLDDRAPARQADTRALWAVRADYEISTSVLAKVELERTQDADRRKEMLALLDDATHVAAAVLTRQDLLVSWNFRHLVNRRRRAMVNEVNVMRGLPHIEIVAPPEL